MPRNNPEPIEELLRRRREEAESEKPRKSTSARRRLQRLGWVLQFAFPSSNCCANCRTTKSASESQFDTIRNSVTTDWTEREAVRARIRVAVKRILRSHGYPPDKQEKATQTVHQQAELLRADWAG